MGVCSNTCHKSILVNIFVVHKQNSIHTNCNSIFSNILVNNSFFINIIKAFWQEGLLEHWRLIKIVSQNFNLVWSSINCSFLKSLHIFYGTAHQGIYILTANLATMGSAPYHPLALRTSLTPGRETPIRVFDWLSYTRKIWNAVRLQNALYAEMRAYKDVRIHFFCHATLNAEASLWLLLHTAHPACVCD